MIGARTETRLCQVRSGTEHPCMRPATRQIHGVPFCEACAREHEAYAAMGELLEAQEMISDWMGRARSLNNEVLAGMLDRMQLEFALRMADANRALKETRRGARDLENAR